MRRYSNSLLNIFLLCSMLCVMSVSAFASLYKPALISPESNTACVSTNSANFVWLQELNAVNYILQVTDSVNIIGNSTTFRPSRILDFPTTNTFQNLTAADLTHFNTQYWWRVVVNYENGNSDTSVIRSFTTRYESPALVAPINAATCEQTMTSLSWVAPEGTSQFRVNVYTDAAMENLVVSTLVNGSSYAFNALENDKIYYWRVRTEQNNCTSEWSETFSFRTAYAAPTLVGPANNAFGTELSFNLYWRADENVDSWKVEYSTNSNMANATTIAAIADTFYTLPALELNTTYFWRVSAMVGTCNSDWTTVRKFTTKYDVPVLAEPLNGATCVPQLAKLSWDAVPTARGYNVEVSEDMNFATAPIVSAVSVTETELMVNLPKGEQVYYWRVKADDSKNTGDWSVVRSFATTFRAVSLVSPANGVSGQPLNATFTWENAFPTNEYIFQLSTAADFTNESIIKIDTLNTNTISAALANYNTTYFWRVAVINSANCNGTWSAVNSISTVVNVPTLVTPANNSIKQKTALAFIWTAVEGAELYDLEVANDNTFGTIVASLYNNTKVNAFISNLVNSTEYFWRVRAKNDDGIGAWSAAFKFTTSLETPVLVYPEHNAVKVPTTVELKWNEVANAEYYKVDVSSDANFATIVETITDLDTNVFTVSDLNNYKVYYWRVAAVKADDTTPWATRSFRTIADTLRVAPELLTPANNEEKVERALYLTWKAIATSENYTVQVSKSEDFATNVLDANPAATTQEFLSQEFEVKYFWRVRANNEVSNSPWSEVRNFTVKPDPASVIDYATGFKAMAMPNPAKDNFVLSIETPQFSAAEVIISDETGKSVKSFNVELSAGQINKVNVNTADLNSGVYFVTIITNFSKVTEKITVAK